MEIEPRRGTQVLVPECAAKLPWKLGRPDYYEISGLVVVPSEEHAEKTLEELFSFLCRSDQVFILPNLDDATALRNTLTAEEFIRYFGESEVLFCGSNTRSNSGHLMFPTLAFEGNHLVLFWHRKSPVGKDTVLVRFADGLVKTNN